MTAHVKTFTNSIVMFGPSPTTKWGSFLWGTGLWGEKGSALNTYAEFLRTKANSVAPTSTVSTVAEFYRTKTNLITPTDLFSKHKAFIIQNDLTLTFETSDEELTDGNGYNYVFTKPANNAENRDITSYTSGASLSDLFTVSSPVTTTWS